MARYDFVCEHCGHSLVVMRLMKDRNKPLICDKCGEKMVRQIGCPGFKFVGKGFYENDYKKPKEMKKEGAK